MPTSDEKIGKRMRSLREGVLNQKQLAAAMAERGWKWTQSTVTAIENGERTLKLSEAVDIADMFGLDHLDELVSRRATRPPSITRLIFKVQDAETQLTKDTFDLLQLRLSLAEAAFDFQARIPGALEEELQDGLKRTPEQIVRDVTEQFVGNLRNAMPGFAQPRLPEFSGQGEHG